ncbi:hypothetical protein F4859DRAFT_26837 [Xylaria cf. heliscus]|nr:hypothetical protein F4859DRAFT_26837 [Xylaria cf. heliscus]
MVPARSLILPTLRGTRGAPLTQTHSNVNVPSASINISRRISTCAVRRSDIRSRKSHITGVRSSSLSTSTSVKKDIATNAGKNGSPSQSRHGSQQTPSPPEDDFKVSFHNLGMNRITKFVVYAVIGVLSTMETIFWCKVLWRWWTGNEEDVNE